MGQMGTFNKKKKATSVSPKQKELRLRQVLQNALGLCLGSKGRTGTGIVVRIKITKKELISWMNAKQNNFKYTAE